MDQESGGPIFRLYLAGGFLGFGISMLIGSILPSLPEIVKTVPLLTYSLVNIISAMLAAYIVTRKIPYDHLKSGLLVGLSVFLVNFVIFLPLSLVFPEGAWRPPLPVWGINFICFSLGGLLGGLITVITLQRFSQE